MSEMWKIIEFSEIAEIYNGNSISKKEKEENYIGLSVGEPYIATKDVGVDHVIDYDNGVLIPKSRSPQFKVAPANSVLVCSEGGSAGRKVAHNDRDTHFGNKLFAIVPTEAIDSKYIYYFTLSQEFMEQFTGLMTGLIGGVSLKKFRTIKLPVPSIKIQKDIVAALDEAFLGINEVLVNAERNLVNTHELYQSYLNRIFCPSESEEERRLRSGWVNIKLKDICTKITDGVHKKPNYVLKGIPFIKINNLTTGTGISFENVSYISKEDHELFCKRTKPEKGDILITKDGTIGVVRIINTEVEFSIFVSVALIKPIDKNISTYLKYVLESPLIQNQIKPQGAALKHLYLRDLREYSIPIAVESERDSIVVRLDTLSNEVQRLRVIYQKKHSDLKELKKSLLQKAFLGELMAENTTNIKKEAVA